MKVFSTDQLKTHLNEKGIKLKRGDGPLFNKYDYYQVINGYKALFIDSVESIDDIINNINSGIDLERYKKGYGISKYTSYNDLEIKICDKIISKYGLEISKDASLTDKIDLINKIKYVHHIYSNNAYYSDFIRMYQFEQDLRSILLKYTLIIEENIKRIFISTLNDMDGIRANYLTNIDNYDTKRDGQNYDNVINSLKKVLELHSIKESKPIKRKRSQDIVIPFWILINEMTMNQTLTTIKNLKYSTKMKVFQSCINEFTLVNYDIFDRSKSSNQKISEKNGIKTFIHILDFIGNFRNMLAHNQPIYMYNIADCSLANFNSRKFTLPKVDDESNRLYNQHRINESMFVKMQNFFGRDLFNSVVHNVDLKLSFIIYVIYKINKILDSKTNCLTEIKRLYYNYNIVLNDNIFIYNGEDCIEKLLDTIEKLSANFDSNAIINSIDSNHSYKSYIKSDYKKFNDSIKTLKNDAKKINKTVLERKYETLFNENAKYIDLTGIDKSYFQNIE